MELHLGNLPADSEHVGRSCSVCERPLAVDGDVTCRLMMSSEGIEMVYIRHTTEAVEMS